MDVKCARIDCGAIRFPARNQTGARQVVAVCEADNPRVNDHVDYAESRKHLDQIEGTHSHRVRLDRRMRCVPVTHNGDMLSYGRVNVETESDDGLMSDGRTATEGETVGLRNDREHDLDYRHAEEGRKGCVGDVVEGSERDERAWFLAAISPGFSCKCHK